MAIPNTRKYSIFRPGTGERATVVAVLPKGADVQAYLKGAARRFDWKAWETQKASLRKVRVGQQKQRRR